MKLTKAAVFFLLVAGMLFAANMYLHAQTPTKSNPAVKTESKLVNISAEDQVKLRNAELLYLQAQVTEVRLQTQLYEAQVKTAQTQESMQKVYDDLLAKYKLTKDKYNFDDNSMVFIPKG